MIDPHPLSPLSALVVEPDHVDRVFVHSTLAAAGFNVVTTNNYADAHAALVAQPPLVLVTAIRLAAYNGLHLALRGRAEHPQMVVVVTSSVPDPVLQRDAEEIGATFVLKPVTAEDLLAAIHRTALRRPNDRGRLEPIQPPFERRHAERRQESVAVVEERRQLHRRAELGQLLLRASITV